jgi:serine phosphatase RsbU (regulator of sigma subunit)
MSRTSSLRTRIGIVVAAGALLVALGVLLLVTNTIKLHSSAQATIRSDAYLVAVVNVEGAVIDAETGLRGYVITGNRLFLAPTQAAATRLPAAAAALTHAAAGDGAFVAMAETLVRQARSFVAGYVPAVERQAQRDLSRAQSLSLTLQGKQLVDGVRATSRALEARVSARDRARQDTARGEAGRATTEGIVVLVLLTALTLVLGTYLGRLVISRQRAWNESERTTAVLRQSLLPSTVPAIPECEVAVRFLPSQAEDLVGGDFYDVFPAGPGQWVIVVGDVCGKGADAAAVTAMARWTLRSRAMSSAAPADALRFLNQAMLSLDVQGPFITVAYVLLTVDGDRAHATVACAGHPPAILVPGWGVPSVLPARGTLLGIWPDIRLETTEVELAHGDSVVLYTDGVSDPGPGPERVAVDALKDRPRDADADQLADAMQAYARQPAGPLRDDVAIVAMRFIDRRRDPELGHGGLRPRALAASAPTIV